MTGAVNAPPPATPSPLPFDDSMSPQSAASALSAGNAKHPAPWAPWAQFGAPMPAAAQFPTFPTGGSSTPSGIPGGSTSKMDIPVVQGAVNQMPQTWARTRPWHPWQVQPGVTEQEFNTLASTNSGSAFGSTPDAVIPYDPFFYISGSNARNNGMSSILNNSIPIIPPGGPLAQSPFNMSAADFPSSGISNFPI